MILAHSSPKRKVIKVALMSLTFVLILPTLNAASRWPLWLEGFKNQNLKPQRVLVVDSSSLDGTGNLAAEQGFEVYRIAQAEFDHGGTRAWAATLARDADVVVYMTDDAILSAPDTFRRLLDPFQDKTVGAVLGRQLPRPEANALESHARLFNYGPEPRVIDNESSKRLGSRAVFMSNSFAAYRASALFAVGNFPANTILCEDVSVAARMLLGAWKIVYAPQAAVFHSHSYSPWQEFKRYFDIGVFQARESWIMKEFGASTSEGWAFARSQFSYLRRTDPSLIPRGCVSLVSKFFGFHLGKRERLFPARLKRLLSLHPNYWKKKGTPAALASSNNRR